MRKIYTLILAVIFTGISLDSLSQTAIDLQGTGNSVEINYELPNAPFTIQYDMYLNSLQNYNGGVTITCGNNPGPLDFYIDVNGTATSYVGNCGAFSPLNPATTFAAQTWYNITHVYPGGGQAIRVYIDGVLVGTHMAFTVGSSSWSTYVDDVIRIGDRSDGATNADARFDNLKVWSVARTEQELNADMTACLSGSEPGLDILMDFEEGTGNTVYDHALGNGAQDGNIIGPHSWSAGKIPTVVTANSTISASTICVGDTVQLSANTSAMTFDISDPTQYYPNVYYGFPCPYGNYYDAAKHQMLVLASELQAMGMTAGPITGMDFIVVTPGGQNTLLSMSVKLGHTNDAALNGTMISTPMTQCFSEPSFVIGGGANHHNFTTPFVWDGVSNIVVETCYNNSALGHSNNPIMSRSITTFASVQSWYDDNDPNLCNVSVGYYDNKRPDMIFYGQGFQGTWSNPTGGIDNPTAASTFGVPTASGEYLLEITDPSSGCTATDTNLITVNANPAINAGPDEALCNGSSVVLNASGADTYSWSPTTGLSSPTSATTVAGPTTTTTYVLTGTDANGCVGTDTLTFTVYQNPSIDLGGPYYQENPPLTLDAGSGYSSYSWGTGATTQTIDVTSTGSYTVTVTDSNGCTGNGGAYVGFTASLENLAGSFDIVKLYPNPSSDYVNIELVEYTSPMNVYLLDAKGALLQSHRMQSELLRLNVSDYASGIYTVRIANEREEKNISIVIK